MNVFRSRGHFFLTFCMSLKNIIKNGQIMSVEIFISYGNSQSVFIIYAPSSSILSSEELNEFMHSIFRLLANIVLSSVYIHESMLDQVSLRIIINH